ncbi:FxsA family protein [Mycobacterium parmense]|uniref:Membrane protein FxsA n=1 Tax=Mycobacterium parmense TaxID=185642 RepID=A0A7I7YRH7_9MYCO|nr:FxsA family protein [Mycobacterium parmense]MCV7349533.1 FxsA family protein [Mycobacterium parmense]ORW58833.1 exclusion suppressor FxsA [Mycobacterium parmense]BBZ43837.1 membrane protein FxsA [Mycobacterium parmense]
MLGRLFLIYAIAEVSVTIALASAVGWGATLLALVAAFLLGWGVVAPMAGSQLVRRILQLRSASAEARGRASDGAMIALATVLVLVPGLLTSAVGLLLLVPPIRSVARPAVSAVALRGLSRWVPLVTFPTTFSAAPRDGRSAGGQDVIDGEVVDVHDFEPAALPADMAEGRGTAPRPDGA